MTSLEQLGDANSASGQFGTGPTQRKSSHEGFIYIFDKKSADGNRKTWRCECKDYSCRARIHTDAITGDVRKNPGDHNHDSKGTARQNESLFRSNGTHVFVPLGFRSDGISSYSTLYTCTPYITRFNVPLDTLYMLPFANRKSGCNEVMSRGLTSHSTLYTCILHITRFNVLLDTLYIILTYLLIHAHLT